MSNDDFFEVPKEPTEQQKKEIVRLLQRITTMVVYGDPKEWGMLLSKGMTHTEVIFTLANDPSPPDLTKHQPPPDKMH